MSNAQCTRYYTGLYSRSTLVCVIHAGFQVGNLRKGVLLHLPLLGQSYRAIHTKGFAISLMISGSLLFF